MNYIYTIIKFLWWRMNGNWNWVFHLLCLPQDMLTLINIFQTIILKFIMPFSFPRPNAWRRGANLKCLRRVCIDVDLKWLVLILRSTISPSKQAVFLPFLSSFHLLFCISTAISTVITSNLKRSFIPLKYSSFPPYHCSKCEQLWN